MPDTGPITYRPGSWTAVLADGFVAMLGGEPDVSMLDDLWELAARGAGVVEALAVVSRGGLVALPPFALATRDTSGRVQVALRGGVQLRLDEPGGTRWVGAGEVSTWSERVLPAGADVHLRVDGAAEGAQRPLVAGVVGVAEVICPGTERPAGRRREDAAATSETAPAVEPVRGGDAAASPPAVAPPVVPVVPTPSRLRLAPPQDAGRAPDAPDGSAASAEPSFVSSPEPVVSVTERTVPVSPQERLARAAGAPAADQPQRQQAAWPAGAGAPDGPRSARSTLSGDVSTTIVSGQLAYLRDRLPVWGNDLSRRPEPPSQPPARLVLSTGLVVALDRPVVLGRAPQAARVSSAELPRLVSLPSPQHDISRTHAEVRLDDGDVLVTDLDSTNGVLVQRPGRGSRRLRAGEPVVLHEGETVDLGDGVTFVVERGT